MLRGAREHLGIDLAYLTEFVDGEQRFRSLDGDAQPFGIGLDTAVPLEEIYCDRMVRGLLDDVIPDTAEDETVRDLEVTADSGMRAYVAAPIRLPDGRLCGTLCCASQQPQRTRARRSGSRRRPRWGSGPSWRCSRSTGRSTRHSVCPGTSTSR